MLRNLFILLTAMFMGLVYYKFSISKSKDAQNMAFFMKITFLVFTYIGVHQERVYSYRRFSLWRENFSDGTCTY